MGNRTKNSWEFRIQEGACRYTLEKEVRRHAGNVAQGCHVFLWNQKPPV